MELIIDGEAKGMCRSAFRIEYNGHTFNILPEDAGSPNIECIIGDLCSAEIHALHGQASEFTLKDNCIVHKETGELFGLRHTPVNIDEFNYVLTPLEMAKLLDPTVNYEASNQNITALCNAVQENIFDVVTIGKLLTLPNGESAFAKGNMGHYKKYWIDHIFSKFQDERPARKMVWALSYNPSAIMGIISSFHDAPPEIMNKIIKYTSTNLRDVDAEAIKYIYGAAQKLQKRTLTTIQ